MLNRVPRKKKKIAKKIKAKADTLVLVQAAMAMALSVSQVAIITAAPIPITGHGPSRAVSIVEAVKNCVRVQSEILSQMKPWRDYVR